MLLKFRYLQHNKGYMEFPIRNITHTIERRAVEILTYSLPEEWIVREMTERDYGIDLYIEIVGKDRKVTGKLVAIQVKGKTEIKFNSNGKYTFSGIKRATINYWNNLPVPVFTIVVCIKTQTPYWASIDAQNREGRFKGENKTTSVRIKKEDNFNKIGLLAFNLTYSREKKWPGIESAIEKSLMSFTSFGPFCLICRRRPDTKACSTTIQYLLLQHYENYYLLSKHLYNKRPKPITYWYKEHLKYLKKGEAQGSLQFSYKLIKEMIIDFASDYREATRIANLLVVKHQAFYFSRKFPHLFVHLKKRPLTFVESDWFARYYWDEYENETQNIEMKFFDDFDGYDYLDLVDEINC